MSMKSPIHAPAHFVDGAVAGGVPFAISPVIERVDPARVLVLFGADWDNRHLPQIGRAHV